MELKPGYKQTEVGVIPEDWDVQTMATLAKITTGPFGTLLKASEYSGDGSGVPLVSVGEVRDGYIKITEHTPRVPPTVIRRLPQYVLRAGDIVFGRKGAVDRSALITKKEEGYFLGSDGISVRLSGPCIPIYVSCQLRSHRIRSWLLQNAIGTTMASLNQGILIKIPLGLPPRPEQEAIASALSDMDGLIEGLDKLISKKQGIKQAAMQELLTGKRRLPGFEGEWEEVVLGDHATFFKGKGLPKSDLTPSGSYGCIHYGELFTLYAESIRETRSYTSKLDGMVASQANDVLMPTSDVTPYGLAKASCICRDSIIIGGDILVIRPDSSRINGIFLSHLVRRDSTQILRLVTGTTVYHIYSGDMKRFAFSLPSITEQEAIVKFFEDIGSELNSLQAKLEKAKAIKQGMMQQLLTGKIRLT
jgi:type I restriction enzyme S subunit